MTDGTAGDAGTGTATGSGEGTAAGAPPPATGAGAPPPATGEGTPSLESLTAEVEKWRDLSRKNEERAKGNAGAAKELAELKRSGMSEMEAAVDKAREEGRAEALAATGGMLVKAEVRAQAAGRPLDADALLEGIDPARFLGDDFQPKQADIVAWLDKVAPVPEPGEGEADPPDPRRLMLPDLGQGTRSGGKPDHALNGDPLLRDIKAKLGVK